MAVDQTPEEGKSGAVDTFVAVEPDTDFPDCPVLNDEICGAQIAAARV